MIFEKCKTKNFQDTPVLGDSIRAERPFIREEIGMTEYFDGDGLRMYTNGKKHYVADIYDTTFKVIRGKMHDKKTAGKLMKNEFGIVTRPSSERTRRMLRK